MRITANQVTFARLILMPAVSALLYGGETALMVAVVLGTIVGCTDFVDGYLARRQGPTVLGGLMDPIADKVFIALAFLPYVDLEWVPWAAIAALFLREFLVTALRSSFEQRQRQLPSTYLAKIKTWVQMCGLLVLMLGLVVKRNEILVALYASGVVAALLGLVVFRLVTKRTWRGAWIFAGCFFGVSVMQAMVPKQHLPQVIVGIVLVYTWLTAFDYLLAARGVIRSLHSFDAARLVGAIALPLLAVSAIVHTDTPAWAPMVLCMSEFAVGGLDNLLAHHGAAPGALAWGGRVLLASLLLALAHLLPAVAGPLVMSAALVSVAGASWLFIRNRRFYLEERLREQRPAPAASA
ncbi:MAG: CDP-alcohol phosphatidyltransferase family protein [Myxococcales bacterium]|nr:CDP-alcohol phosphatidyltransferase family protein [Myxococcales bacterium]